MDGKFGFVRVACVSMKVTIGDPYANANEIETTLAQPDIERADVVIFPELCLTGYTCGDLFAQKHLLEITNKALLVLCKTARSQLILVGAPILHNNSLYNCAVAIHDGKIVGIIPKQNLPTYKEFYESRWFRAGSRNDSAEIKLNDQEIPFGIDLLFQDKTNPDFLIGGEICEDVFMPIPPSSHAAIAGATLIFNLSASPEQVAKATYRKSLVVNQSGRCIAAYAYSSAGPTESTSDLVFGGHCLIAENGSLLAESRRVGDGEPLNRNTYWTIADIDYQKLLHDRRSTTSFSVTNTDQKFRKIAVELRLIANNFDRKISGSPFVPKDGNDLEERCAEIFDIQTAALCKRLERLPADSVFSIGISGGLDSTLATLALLRACRTLNIPKSRIKAVTMPGFGTTEKTKTNAVKFMELVGLTWDTIDIRKACIQTFVDLDYQPFGINCIPITNLAAFEEQLRKVPTEARKDLNFENIQARHRTLLLMSRGFVIGTGDMSELALGWCTYNADHMSMYNPNCSVPKTLVKFLVKYIAEYKLTEFCDGWIDYMHPVRLKNTLLDIVDTVISPELLPPGEDGEIVHSTENIVGPYELHDFFLFHFVRNGFSPQKILFLAKHAEFQNNYSEADLKMWLEVFYKRFFWSQFKRNCVPDGPKVGSVSLSPRGDWRMPSDAEDAIWTDEL